MLLPSRVKQDRSSCLSWCEYLPTPPYGHPSWEGILPESLLRLIINLCTSVGDKVTVLLGIPEGCPDGTIGFMIVLT